MNANLEFDELLFVFHMLSGKTMHFAALKCNSQAMVCLCSYCRTCFEEKRSILEPAGALALAGAEAYCKYYGLKDKTVVAITSGANMNFDRLRLVAELADVGRQQEAVLATFIPEEKGSLTQFCELVYSHQLILSPMFHSFFL